jgi:hypothetical protein
LQVFPVLDHAEQRRALWRIARIRGFPAVRIREYAQPAGAAAWATYCRTVTRRWLDAAELALTPTVIEADDLALEASARAAEIALLATRLRRHRDLPLEQAEALLETYREQVRAWRAFLHEHAEEDPELLGELDQALLAHVAACRRELSTSCG